MTIQRTRGTDNCGPSSAHTIMESTPVVEEAVILLTEAVMWLGDVEAYRTGTNDVEFRERVHAFLAKVSR